MIFAYHKADKHGNWRWGQTVFKSVSNKTDYIQYIFCWSREKQKRTNGIRFAREINDKLKQLLIFNKIQRSARNGYVKQDITKVKNIIIFFLNKSGSLCPTKLNKLLFYTDFYHYKEYAVGLSGLEYVAYPYGCVPYRYQTIYDNIGGIERDVVEFSNGNIGELLTTKESFDEKIFSESELIILNQVYEKYKNYTPKMISEENHTTKAWIENIGKQSSVRYDYAFEIEPLNE